MMTLADERMERADGDRSHRPQRCGPSTLHGMTEQPEVVAAETVETMITDEMRAVVGEVMSTSLAFPIAASDIRKWALAIYFPAIPPRVFWDEDYAATTRHGGIVAPEEFNPFAWMAREPGPGARPARFGDFEGVFGIAPPPYRAVLQSKVTARYSGVRMRPGDVIHSTDRIANYYERQGRMGLQLYTVVSVAYENQHGEWIKTLDTEFVRYR